MFENRRETYCSICGKGNRGPQRWVVPFRKMACACGKLHLICVWCFEQMPSWESVKVFKGGRWLYLSKLPVCPRTEAGRTSLRVGLELMT